jgi:hypothetical protein
MPARAVISPRMPPTVARTRPSTAHWPSSRPRVARRARDEQTGDVHTRDRQQDPDTGKEREQCRTHVAQAVIFQADGIERGTRRPVVGELPPDLPADGCDLLLSGPEIDPRLHASDHADVLLCARPAFESSRQQLPRLQLCRHAGLRRKQQPESFRHDAEHCRRPTVHLDAPADDRAIAAEAALKERPAQDDARG